MSQKKKTPPTENTGKKTFEAVMTVGGVSLESKIETGKHKVLGIEKCR